MVRLEEREMIVETLLDSLEVEHYVRGPLLATVADELDALGLARVAEAARGVLACLEAGALSDWDFVRAVGALRDLVHGAKIVSAA
ncbi:MAG: hypothetical protein KF819_34010 [Labilithrix sp.]|nr:hypothetical protein [Labilithrix sp.]